MSKEKKMILNMLEEGKITSEDALKLINALEGLEEYRDDFLENRDESSPIDPENIKEDMGKEFQDNFTEIDRDTKDNIENNVRNNIMDNIMSLIETGLSGLDNIGDSFNFNSMDKSNELKGEIIENLENHEDVEINIETINGSILVLPSDEDNLRIKILAKTKERKNIVNIEDLYNYSYENNKLIFKTIDKNRLALALKIYLPRYKYAKLMLSSSNGKIKLEDVKADDISINTSNGSILIETVFADNINCRTRHGSIRVENLVSKALSLTSTNGRILLENSRSSNESIILTNNSLVSIDDLEAKKLAISTTNGNIKILNTSAKEYDLKTTNGNIMLEDMEEDKSYYFNLKTKFGNIDIDMDNLTFDSISRPNSLVAKSTGYEDSSEDNIKVEATTSCGKILIS